MGRVTAIQTNFTNGEIDPLLRARTDIEQFYNGLETATNVIIEPQGGLARRPGLKLIHHIPSAASPQNGTKLIPFTFSTTQSYMLLFTNDRVYIYKDGVLQTNINSSGNDYLASTGITSAMLPNLYHTQNADTLILTHEDLAPKKLVRGASHTTWTISSITFDHIPKYPFTFSTSSPSVTLTPSAVDGNITLTAGGSAFASGNVGDYVEADNGFGRARIIEYTSATVVKAVTEVPFFDTNAVASGDWVLEVDYEPTWSGTKGYPRTCTFHEGRLWFGGSKNRPTTLWGSRVSDFYNFNMGEGLDDDGVEITLDTDAANNIVGVHSGRDLQVFTTGGEFFVPQSDLDPITPNNVVVKISTRRGTKQGIKPVAAETGTYFIQRSGQSLREFLFSDVELSYVSSNVSLLSSHLLKSPTDMALRVSTDTDDGDLLCIVNSTDGSLATYSLLKQQGVVAGSRQTTNGLFKNVAVDVDTIYTVVKRAIDDLQATCTITVTDAANIAVGSTITITDHAGTSTTMTATNDDPAEALEFSVGGTRTNADVADNIAVGTGGVLGINALAGYSAPNPAANVITVTRAVVGGDNLTVSSSDSTRLTVTQFVNGATDKYFVEQFNEDYTTDSAVQKSSAAGDLPTNKTMTGFTHLNLDSVDVINDDDYEGTATVSSNEITLKSIPTTYVEAGFSYAPTVKTMPVELKLPTGPIIDKKKRIVDIAAMIYLSQNLTIQGKTIDFRTFGTSTIGGSVTTTTGTKRIRGLLGYSNDAQITVSQNAPLFFTLLGLEYKVTTGVG